MLWFNLIAHHEVGWKSLVRKTGKMTHEQEPVTKKIKLLLIFSPLFEWLDTTHAVRRYLHSSNQEEGQEEATPASHNQIKSFVDYYKINMDDFEPSDLEQYRTFEDFFVRKHKEGTRPVHEPENDKIAVCAADSRVVVYDTVALSKKLWIKGKNFSITNLVMDNNLGKQFEDGSVASFRLSPQDYHRYHSPVSGRIKQFRSMPGDYYEVDPLAIQSSVDILTSNARDFVVIETAEFGHVLFVAIGATEVGTVYFHERFRKPGTEVKKGEELGIFQFGGSAIVVAFGKDRIHFDDDLRLNSLKKIQVAVEVGMSLGEATQSKAGGREDNNQEASYAEVVREG
jgi:phosphatidylserine decarboxylase precursor